MNEKEKLWGTLTHEPRWQNLTQKTKEPIPQVEFILETKHWFNSRKPIHVSCQNNILKPSNDTIILTDAEKALNKSQHQFMIKNCHQTEGDICKLIISQTNDSIFRGESKNHFP